MNFYYNNDYGLGGCGLSLGVAVNKSSLITTFRNLELMQLSDLFLGARGAETGTVPLTDVQC